MRRLIMKTEFKVCLFFAVIRVSAAERWITETLTGGRDLNVAAGSNFRLTCHFSFDRRKDKKEEAIVEWIDYKHDRNLYSSHNDESAESDRVSVSVTRRRDHIESTLTYFGAAVEDDSNMLIIGCKFSRPKVYHLKKLTRVNIFSPNDICRGSETPCTDNADECNEQTDMCENGAACKNTVGGYICQCPSGYRGPTCEDVDERMLGVGEEQRKMLSRKKRHVSNYSPIPGGCESNLCMHGSFCIANDAKTYSCLCSAGYTGALCKKDINECNYPRMLCMFGTCQNTPGSYVCRCPAGHKGKRCEDDIDECKETKDACKNGGTCQNKFGSFVCTCPPNYRGKRCEDDIDECKETKGLCKNGGTCQNNDGSFVCTCPPKYRGKTCADDIDKCKETKGLCKNGGTCQNNVGSFVCICPSNYRGPTCADDVDECKETKGACKNGGTCQNKVGSFVCICPPVYRGPICEYVNHCVKPCQNNGTCISLNGKYYCNCTTEFTGKFCDDDVIKEFKSNGISTTKIIITCTVMIALVLCAFATFMSYKR